ncbi:MAG TPA: transcription elongation factor GreA [Caulobacteraceae bacterium]|jgi:transcription elongation GreA/GreB family factor|nr:transcription elongation factor GreA [Caulobacteraceae bacterium]
MSVAFTKETDVEAHAADLPDRPISHHPNLVTAEGLTALEAELATAQGAYTDARAGDVQQDRTALARAVRDLRYWQARRASAQLTQRDPSKSGVQFGDRVAIEREDGRAQTFRIVGEDEADPKAGSISWVSPLAQALLGKSAGDVVTVAGAEVELTAIS